MKKLLCILFLLCSVITYSQTFYSPVIVKKTLRVDGRTALGGIEYTEDLTITADTILINGLDGTGNILIIDVDGNVLRGTGTGTGGISGLVPTEVLFGKSDGTIDQDPDFYYDDVLDKIGLTSTASQANISMTGAGGNTGYYGADGVSVQNGLSLLTVAPNLIQFQEASAITTDIQRTAGGSNHVWYLPNAQGGANTVLRNDGSGNLTWVSPSTGTVTSIATTSPIGGGTITTTGTLNLLGSAADRILYTTGVNTWAETVSTSFGRSLMDDANAAAGLATLGIPVDANRILFGDGTGLTNTIDFTYDISTNILDVGKFHVDGDDGWITYYEGATLTDGQLLIGRTSDGVLKLGTITSSDLTVGYSDPNITLDYAAGSIASGDLAGSIDATKIADGSVTSTEFQYINTLSSNAQTQLNSKGFTIIISGSQNTIADATNYYSGATQNNSGGTADINRIYIPVNCTLTAAYGFFLNAGTLGSGESGTFYIRKNNTTDVTVSSAVTTSATHNTFNGTGLSGSYSAGDYLEGKWLTPTYATNPSNCRWVVTLFFTQN